MRPITAADFMYQHLMEVPVSQISLMHFSHLAHPAPIPMNKNCFAAHTLIFL
jgi:hypothetical protein